MQKYLHRLSAMKNKNIGIGSKKLIGRALILTGFPRIFKYHFPYFFNTFSILNLRS